MGIDIRRQAEELVRYYSELVRRLPQHGMRDVAEMLSLYDQLRGALGAIGRQEISWAAEQTQHLVEELVRMDAHLQALRRLKTVFDRLPDGRAADADRGRGTL